MMLRVFACLLLAVLAVGSRVSCATEPRPALKVPLATKVVFLDIAKAGKRILAAGERGVIVYSDDAGTSWAQADVPTRGTLTALAFVDDKTGYAVGHDAAVLKTTDGGASWKLAFFDPDSRNVMLNVRFRDANTGYVVGTNGLLWITKDGGEQWDRRTLSVEDWYQNHLFDVAWLASGPTLVAAEKGVLYRSPDGWSDFAAIASPYSGSFFGVLTLPGDAFLLYGMKGHVFLSGDGGVAWQQVETSTEQFLLDAAPLPDGRVLIVGAGGVLVVVDPRSSQAQVATRPGGVGINAVLVAGGDAYLAGLDGGVKKVSLAELLPR